jgi:hypothetical protein
MTRLATCEGGTRLVRCGERVQLCGTTGLACGSLGRHFACPEPNAELAEIVDTVYPGHRWAFAARWGTTNITADREPFPSNRYTGTYTTTLDDFDRWVGVFGLSIQWGRPPTIAEVIADAGLAAFDVITRIGEPRGVGGAIGRFYMAMTQETGTGAIGGTLSAGDLPTASNRLGVTWETMTGGCSFTENPRPDLGYTDVQFQRLTGDATTAAAQQGRERFVNDPSGTAYPGLADGARVFAEFTERAVTVTRIGDAVALPDNWEGPADGLVCPDDGGGIDPQGGPGNAAAIAGLEAIDPLRRPGCCG